MAQGGENIGRIYVDIDANLGPLEQKIKAAQKLVDAMEGKGPGSSRAAVQPAINIQKKALNDIQRQLNAQNYSVRITEIKLARGVMSAFKASVEAALKGIKISVDVGNITTASGGGRGQGTLRAIPVYLAQRGTGTVDNTAAAALKNMAKTTQAQTAQAITQLAAVEPKRPAGMPVGTRLGTAQFVAVGTHGALRDRTNIGKDTTPWRQYLPPGEYGGHVVGEFPTKMLTDIQELVETGKFPAAWNILREHETAAKKRLGRQYGRQMRSAGSAEKPIDADVVAIQAMRNYISERTRTYVQTAEPLLRGQDIALLGGRFQKTSKAQQRIPTNLADINAAIAALPPEQRKRMLEEGETVAGIPAPKFPPKTEAEFIPSERKALTERQLNARLRKRWSQAGFRIAPFGAVRAAGGGPVPAAEAVPAMGAAEPTVPLEPTPPGGGGGAALGGGGGAAGGTPVPVHVVNFNDLAAVLGKAGGGGGAAAAEPGDRIRAATAGMRAATGGRAMTVAQAQEYAKRQARLAGLPVPEFEDAGASVRLAQRQRAAEMRAGGAAAGQQIPGRSASTGLASIVSSLFGRANIAELEANRAAAAQNLTSSENELAKLQDQRAGLAKAQIVAETSARALAAKQPAKGRAAFLAAQMAAPEVMGKQIEVLDEQITKANKTTGEFRETFEKTDAAFKRATGPIAVARNLGALFIGGKLFLAFSATVSEGMKAIETAAAPAIDQLTGFTAVSTKVTNALGAQTFALHGNVQAAVAATAGQAGLSTAATAFVQGVLGPSAIAKAGAQAAGGASDIFRAMIPGGAPQGLYGGYGGLFGGPALGGLLGGGKGFTEQIAGDLGVFADLANKPRVSGVNTSPLVNLGLEPAFTTRQPTAAEVQSAKDLTSKYLENVNSEQQRALSYLGKTADTLQLQSTTNEQILKDFQATGDAAGDSANAANIAKSNIALIDTSTGQAVTDVQKYRDFWLHAAQGATTMTKEDFLAISAQQMGAQRQALQVSATRQISQLIPGQLGMQLAAQPFIPAGAGVLAPGQKAPPGIAAQLAETQALQNKLTQQGQAGLAGLQAMVTHDVGAEAGQQFAAAAAEITSAGQAIAAFQTQIANLQTGLTYASYLNNLRLANRAIADAKGAMAALAGNTAAASKSLGGLSEMEALLGRQSQALSLALSQRQINFQVAVAGFTAPGLTSEERAARIQEAKIEAAYAQKQLDIQKQQYVIGGQVLRIQAERALVDATRAAALLNLEYQTQIAIAAVNKRIATLQTEQQQAVARANALLSQAQGNFDAALNVAAQGISQFGKAMGTVAGVIEAYFAGLPGAPITPGPGQGTQRRAGGALFNTHGATSMMVGEAGTETVAVLRNPRAMLTPMGGGGGVVINIPIQNFNGTAENYAELRRFINQTINDKAALMGLRNFVG